MRYETVEGTTHIHAEEGETEEAVLRAIIRASFDLARPAGVGWLRFEDSREMTDEDAGHFVSLTPRYEGDKCVLDMDYVQGRQCKTRLYREGDGHFRLDNYIYERDRGTPEPMLERAKELLAGKKVIGTTPTGLVSTSHMFKGNNLNIRLAELGYTRRPGESDWNFRKRIFPELWQQSPDEAIQYLMGCSAAEWNPLQKFLYMDIMWRYRDNPSCQELVKFAQGFVADPLEMWERETAAPTN